LDEKTKECLHKQGGYATLALYVPLPEYQKSESSIITVSSNENPENLAQRYGTMVAVLKLKRVK